MLTVLRGDIVFTKGEIQFSILLPTDVLCLCVPVCSVARSPAIVKISDESIIITNMYLGKCGGGVLTTMLTTMLTMMLTMMIRHEEAVNCL